MADLLATGVIAQAIRDRLNTQLGTTLALTLCQVGTLGDYPYLEAAKKIEADAPFILVAPAPATRMGPSPAIGQTWQLQDEFRIVYGRLYEGAANQNPVISQMADVKLIVDELTASMKPTWITSILYAGLSLRSAFVGGATEGSLGIEWEGSAEQGAIDEVGADVKITVIIFVVRYQRL